MEIPAALSRLQELGSEPTSAAMIVVDTGRERWLILEQDFDIALHAGAT